MKDRRDKADRPGQPFLLILKISLSLGQCTKYYVNHHQYFCACSGRPGSKALYISSEIF